MIFGVMVTASHNPSADNGLKIVEPPHAHMLNGASEARATELARAHSAEDFKKIFEDVHQNNNTSSESSFSVIIGWDTRPSCKDIVEALRVGITAVGGKVILAGEMVTPMLHWCVEKANEEVLQQSSPSSCVVPDLNLYLKDRFGLFTESVLRDCQKHGKKKNRHVIVDCANGVGTKLMEQLVARYTLDANKLSPVINYTFQLINTDTSDVSKLNHNCGADYVQKNRLLPEGLSREEFAAVVKHKIKNPETDDVIFYSLDGDSDRIVAGHCDPKDGSISILEGDRFTALFATIVLQGYAKPSSSSSEAGAPLTFGAVQTAYANGASTLYLRDLPVYQDPETKKDSVLKTEFALTGVKYVHAAAEKYDLGLYFESNGHGTVLASKKAVTSSSSSSSSLSQQGRTVAKLCSQSCGDAVANLLACEYGLLSLDWTTHKWCHLYEDLCCVQRKVLVPDPTVFKCAPGDEQTLVKPEGAQEKILQAIKEVAAEEEEEEQGKEKEKGDDVVEDKVKKNCYRAFVRPSGTEAVVRLYVESRSSEGCEKLTNKLEKLVKDLI